MKPQEIIIIKFGGSFLAPKDTIKLNNREDPFIKSINDFYTTGNTNINETIKNATNILGLRTIIDDFARMYQKSSNDKKFIIIHGAGKIGHSSANRIEGWKTHYLMRVFNQVINEEFHRKRIPTVPIPSIHQTTSTKIHEGTNNTSEAVANYKLLFELLELDNIPLLYGDMILNAKNEWVILSGDLIPELLARYLQETENINSKFVISKVIYVSQYENVEEGGLYTGPPEETNSKLISEVRVSKDDIVLLTKDRKKFSLDEIAFNNNKKDLSGGIGEKINAAARLVKKYNFPINLIGTNHLTAALKNNDVGTRIILSPK